MFQPTCVHLVVDANGVERGTVLLDPREVVWRDRFVQFDPGEKVCALLRFKSLIRKELERMARALLGFERRRFDLQELVEYDPAQSTQVRKARLSEGELPAEECLLQTLIQLREFHRELVEAVKKPFDLRTLLHHLAMMLAVPTLHAPSDLRITQARKFWIRVVLGEVFGLTERHHACQHPFPCSGRELIELLLQLLQDISLVSESLKSTASGAGKRFRKILFSPNKRKATARAMAFDICVCRKFLFTSMITSHPHRDEHIKANHAAKKIEAVRSSDGNNLM